MTKLIFMKIKLSFALVIFVLSVNISASFAVNDKIGASCTKLNETMFMADTKTSETKKITCIKVGNKLVWDSGVKIPKGGPSGDGNSLDPVQKGLHATNGKCVGKGSTKMTFAPMASKDIGSIFPMGGYGGSHVTPIDHQYYYQIDRLKPKDSYPVFAVVDGNLNSVGFAGTPTKSAWNITLSYSCTFMIFYNLMTSLSPSIMAKLPSNWNQIGGAIKVPVKAGEIIGYVGGQSLDFQVIDTTRGNPQLLHRTAYNNREPFKVVTVGPLAYFTDAVKAQILPFYLREAEPRDGVFAYDVDGQAVGNWFVVGTNGYAGGNLADGTTNEAASHLSLAYDPISPEVKVLSIGNYKNLFKPSILSTQFAIKGNIDWTKITKDSGIVKAELAESSIVSPSGQIWSGGYVKGLKVKLGITRGTALIKMIDKDHLKVQIFVGKTPDQVSDFTNAAVTYDRGQDARLVLSTTQSGPKKP